MKYLSLLVVSAFAASSARATGLTELKALAGDVEIAAPAEVAGRAVLVADAGIPAATGGWSALAAETVRRGNCMTYRPEEDGPAEFYEPSCSVVINPEPSERGGVRAYAMVFGAAGGAPLTPSRLYYYAENKTVPIGVGVYSGTTFWAVQSVIIEVNASGVVRDVTRTYQTIVGDERACINASRTDRYLVRDGSGQRTAVVCTYRVPLQDEERTGYLYQAQEDWAAALRR